MGIGKRLILITALLMAVAFGVDGYFDYADARQNAITSLQNQAERIRGVIMATRRVYHLQFLASEIPLTEKTLGFLPAHALPEISTDFANWDTSGVHFNNVSDQPRNPENQADVNEMKVMQYFRNNKEETRYFKSFQDDEGNPFYLYANPIWVETYCLECHGKREHAPKSIRDNYTTSFDYNVGELRGILSIKLPSGIVENNASAIMRQGFVGHLVLFIGMFVLIFYTVRKYVKQPLQQLGHGMKDIASGNYKSRLVGFKGELSDIEKSFNSMAEKIPKHLQTITRARKEAEEANKAKSEFLANMSHELRTPLNAVLGFSQMLQYDQKNLLSETQKEHVHCIQEGGEHLLTLVNDILDLAKIEVDQIAVTLEEVSINDVATECVKLINPLGETRNINIINHLAGKALATIRTDKIKFKQALLNLLSNAIKFNKKGGTVTLDAYEVDASFIHISVTDNGSGIAKENFSAVFQIFNRLEVDPMVAQEGAGIGLPVTKMLIERMSGRIGFESDKGVGSTFWIELPLFSNENILVWEENLRIGIDAIDKDHQALILHTNSISYKPIDENHLANDIGDLIDFVRYHFRREEAIMDICHYPDLVKHRQLHWELEKQVGELADEWHKERNPEVLFHLRSFLHDWLINHIVEDDLKIAPYAKGRAQDIVQALDSFETYNKTL